MSRLTFHKYLLKHKVNIFLICICTATIFHIISDQNRACGGDKNLIFLQGVQNISITLQPKTIHFTTKWRACNECQHFIYTEDASKYCPRCVFTENPRDFNSSDAVVFHGRYLGEFPKYRSPKQIWIYMLFENPHVQWNTSISKGFSNAFNWTMTYRTDSDIISPYGGFIKRSNRSLPPPPPNDRWAYHLQTRNYELLRTPSPKAIKKKKLAVWIASRCSTWGRREDIVKEMQKFIHIDVFGKCGSLECTGNGIEDCKFDIGSKYKFYLAFENGICQDYVTEKYFSTLLTEMVPVVYGGANYSRFFPPKSYINIADFKSIKALTQYLTFLGDNQEAYLEYFKWREDYWVYNNRFTRGWCGICDKLWEVDKTLPSKAYSNIIKWWATDSSGKTPACVHPKNTGWKILDFIQPLKNAKKAN